MIDISQYSPCPLYQGINSLSKIENLVVPHETVLLITSQGMLKRTAFAALTEHLHNIDLVIKTVPSNPDLDKLDQLKSNLASEAINRVVAFGGGSVMDSAKVLSVMLYGENKKLSLADVLRQGISFSHKRIPLINIPTTSGTGAEVTPFATVWDFANSKKKSFASDALVPDCVILDPQTTYGSPIELTVICALDTCSHAMESLWNKNATKQSVLLAQEALEIFVNVLPKLLKVDSLEGRSQLQVASFVAGLAISITRTAIAHSISYPVTLHFGMPHGLACAFTLPNIAQLVSDNKLWAKGTNQELIESVMKLLHELHLPALTAKYCSKTDLLNVIPEMNTKGRADNFVLDNYSLESILQ